MEFPLTIDALRAHGKASVQVARAVSVEWVADPETGKRDGKWYETNMQPALAAAGFTMPLATARAYVATIETAGDDLDGLVDQYGWTQTNEAIRRGNTGNLESAKRVLIGANQDKDGNPIQGRATVEAVKAVADDLKVKASGRKAKAAKRPLTVANLTQADIARHDKDAVTAYRKALATQLSRADKALAKMA